MPYLAARVTLGDVASSLDKHRTALYRLWPTQHDFWVDLTLYLTYSNDFRQSQEEMPWAATESALGPVAELDAAGAMESFRRRFNLTQDLVLDDVWILVRGALLGYEDVPGVAQVRREVELARLDDLGAYVGERLALLGLGISAPFTQRDVAAALWCISDGTSIANRFAPDVGATRVMIDDGEGPAGWGLAAYAMRTTLLGTAAPSKRTAVPSTGTSRRRVVVPDLAKLWTSKQRVVLEAATDLFLRSIGPAAKGVNDRLHVLDHVTIARVARAARVSRQAIYEVWPSEAEMLRELLGELLREKHDELLLTFDEALPPGGSPAVVLERATRRWLSPAARPDTTLAFLPESADQHVGAILRDAHHRLVDALASRVEDINAGRPLRSGIDATQIATSWVTMLDGGRRLVRTAPAALRHGSAPGSSSRSIVAAAAASLLEHGAEDAPLGG